MVFNNPTSTSTIEGRLPTKNDDFFEDRFYASVDRVFVRFDPHKDFIRVIFPCESEVELRITYEAMEELAKKDATILDILKGASNVEDVYLTPTHGCSRFSEDFDYYIKFKKSSTSNIVL